MQVLSNSVAKALQLTQGDEVAETITFVDKFNKFFDTLNVSSISAGKLKRSPFKDPYRSASDFRLKVIIYTASVTVHGQLKNEDYMFHIIVQCHMHDK